MPRPDQLLTWLTTGNGKRLEQSRQAVGVARQAHKGIFANDAQGPLALLPFDLRYLARRGAPDRYVLDLSQAGITKAGIILEPKAYHRIQNIEDRLFVEADDLLSWSIISRLIGVLCHSIMLCIDIAIYAHNLHKPH